jgi:protein PhnA
MPCAVCSASAELSAFVVPPVRDPADVVAICGLCRPLVEGSDAPDPVIAALLREAVWSDDAGVQVLAWRLLHRIQEPAVVAFLDQVWLDEERLAWARAGLAAPEAAESGVRVVDSNGATLVEGDAVTLVKDLEVKGAGFTAKRGTLVKGIHLTDDPALVEGRVNGMMIVLKTVFLKRA